MKNRINFPKWFDEWKMAWVGVVLLTKNYKFLIVSGATFLIFGTIMNLLSVSGLGVLKMLNFRVVLNAMIGLFGINKSFLDWAVVFFVALLQGILIGTIFIVWKKRKDNQSENTQTAGIAAGLAILGTGCPTCGTTLLMPIVEAIFSGSSFMLAGIVSEIITIVAIVILLLAIKRVGLEAYVIIKSEKFRNKRGSENEKDS